MDAAGNNRHISGYSGHVPGDKYKFGSRSPRPSPRLPPLNGYRRQSSANGYRGRPEWANALTRSRSTDTLYSNVATQFPVPVRDESIQTGSRQQSPRRGIQFDERQRQHEGVGAAPPQEKTIQQNDQSNVNKSLDGRVVNNHQPGTLFMHDNPFQARNNGGRGGAYNRLGRGRNGFNGRRTPMPGYSGHIPGMEGDFGKPFSIAAHESREREMQRFQEQARNPRKIPTPLPRHEYVQAHWKMSSYK